MNNQSEVMRYVVMIWYVNLTEFYCFPHQLLSAIATPPSDKRVAIREYNIVPYLKNEKLSQHTLIQQRK